MLLVECYLANDGGTFEGVAAVMEDRLFEGDHVGFMETICRHSRGIRGGGGGRPPKSGA